MHLSKTRNYRRCDICGTMTYRKHLPFLLRQAVYRFHTLVNAPKVAQCVLNLVTVGVGGIRGMPVIVSAGL